MILTTHPLLRTVQAIASYDDVEVGQQITGWVARKAETGTVVEFFGGVTGFLSNKHQPEELPIG